MRQQKQVTTVPTAKGRIAADKVENMDRGQVLPHRKEPLPIGDPGPHLIHGIDMQIQRDILNLNF